MNTVPNVTLNNGVSMPQLGFGVFQVPPGETKAAVAAALETGYRSIDTAAAYENEQEVGQALAESGLSREDVFITTKLWNSNHGYDNALRAFDNSLSLLGVDSVDLYLIHWPMPEQDRYVETWRALESLYSQQRVRAIGVSNFKSDHLRRLVENSEVVPAVNQVELHPYLQQGDLRQYHAEQGILTEAWSPLAQGGGLLTDPTVTEIGKKYGCGAAQVVLRWHLQLGNIVIPKSVTPSRIQQNFDVFGFTLDDQEMATMAALDRGERIGPDPDDFNTG